MQYTINKKNVKQSIQNLSRFLKEKGYDIPRNIILDSFSKSIFFKNWNTLEAITEKPQIIQYIPEKKVYLIEVDCELNENDFLNVLKKVFLEAKCQANINDFKFFKNSYHVEITFPNKNDNFLTAMFLLSDNLKLHNVTRFDILRIFVEKENLLPAININFKKNK